MHNRYSVLLALLFALLVSACDRSVPERTQSHPNIIVVMTDDEPATLVEELPNIKEQLIDRGVWFRDLSFVDYSLCCPSRASFFTGLNSANTTIIGNVSEEFGSYRRWRPLFEKDALPTWLKAAGYQTGLFGKYMNGYGNYMNGKKKRTGIPEGWDRWVIKTDRWDSKRYFIDGSFTTEAPAKGENMDDVTGRLALQWIEQKAGGSDDSRPFFAYIAFHAPHEGHVPPPRAAGRYKKLKVKLDPSFNEESVTDKPVFRQIPLMTAKEEKKAKNKIRKSYEQLVPVDDFVGEAIDLLRDTGQLGNTVFIFTSDNGYSNGEHRRTAGKRLITEEVIRVPLIIRGEGFGIPEGVQRNDYLVNNLDVVAYIADLAGATPPWPLDGKSLRGPIEGAEGWRTAIRIEGDLGDEGQEKADVTIDRETNRQHAVRTRDWLFISTTLADGVVEELYDLRNDPYCLENAAANSNYSAAIADLRALNDRLADCAGEGCWVTSGEPPAAPQQ